MIENRKPAFRNAKYEATGETKLYAGRTLHRIRAVVDIPPLEVVAGTLGGWIEKPGNLDEDGYAWVFGDAMVFGDAFISDNARVSGDAVVFGRAWISDNASVSGNARISVRAHVSGDAQVYGDAELYDDGGVHGNARVYDGVRVFDSAQIHGNANVSGNARISEDAQVFGNALVFGNAHVSGNAHVFGDALVSNQNHLGWISVGGSAYDTLTWFLQSDCTVRVQRDHFDGTLAEFAEAVEKTHGDSQHGQEYRLLIQFIELRAAAAMADFAPTPNEGAC